MPPGRKLLDLFEAALIYMAAGKKHGVTQEWPALVNGNVN